MPLNANLFLATISSTICGQAFWGTGGRRPLQNFGNLWWLNGGHEPSILCLSKNLSTADTVAFLSKLCECAGLRIEPLHCVQCTKYNSNFFQMEHIILFSIMGTFPLNVLLDFFREFHQVIFNTRNTKSLCVENTACRGHTDVFWAQTTLSTKSQVPCGWREGITDNIRIFQKSMRKIHCYEFMVFLVSP